MKKEIGQKIYNLLLKCNSKPQSELYFTNEFECLIAVLLSAQCTDARVNKVSKALFERYKNANDVVNSSVEEISGYIKSVNYYPTKAKNIYNLCKKLCECFNGKVPSDFSFLVSLPGVGRKTAQVVMIEAFNKPAIPVDTHIFRVCNRLGIASASKVIETEEAIRQYFDEDQFAVLHKLLVLHGRYVCKARVPDCENCVLKDVCQRRI